MNPLLLTNLEWVWPNIAKAARKAFAGADWTEHNLRELCKRRQALVFANDDGVAVVELVHNPYRSEFELVVLFACSIGEHGAVEKYLPEIEQVARDLNAKRIVFWSHRRGWDRHLPPGFKLRRVEYALEVDHERQKSGDAAS